MFSLPSYLNIPAFGLDISDRSFKYLRLTKDKRAIRVESFNSREIPVGIIEGGDIKNPDELGKILAQEFRSVDNPFVVVSLPEERGFVGDVRLPPMDPQDIRKALEFQLSEHIPMKPQEVVFDFAVISHSEHAGDHLDLVLYAFPVNLLDGYVKAIMTAGLIPVAFELEGHALSRSVVSPEIKHAVLLVDFGATHVSFTIVHHGIVYFTATIDVAGFELDRSISKSLNVTPEEAQRLKKEAGFVKNTKYPGLYEALLPVLDRITGEMKRHIDFWATHNKETGPVEEIILSGGDSNLYGLIEFLSLQLNLPVRLADAWSHMRFPDKYIPPVHFRDSLSFATVIGLALRGL